MIMLDTLRTLAGIRKERRLPPPGAQPQTGSNIVFETLRIHLKYPITLEQWIWLSEKGWRKIDMRTNRRHYFKVADQFVQRLVQADDVDEREEIYQKILTSMSKASAQR